MIVGRHVCVGNQTAAAIQPVAPFAIIEISVVGTRGEPARRRIDGILKRGNAIGQVGYRRGGGAEICIHQRANPAEIHLREFLAAGFVHREAHEVIARRVSKQQAAGTVDVVVEVRRAADPGMPKAEALIPRQQRPLLGAVRVTVDVIVFMP